jgi:hypothetical protein
MTEPSFADNVRIVETPITIELGLAGLVGVLYGHTTPSLMAVSVIGEPAEDFALNVYFAERNESFWFARELVELVDHAPGTEIGGVRSGKKWVRRSDGGWDEKSD